MTAFKNGDYPYALGVTSFNAFEQVILMRVKDNVLYYDWPWGRDRILEYQLAKNNGSKLQPVTNVENYKLLLDTLLLVSVDDSVFMMGGEVPSLPWLLTPFPSFSFAPKLANSEMPLPWAEAYHRSVTVVGYLSHRLSITTKNSLLPSHHSDYPVLSCTIISYLTRPVCPVFLVLACLVSRLSELDLYRRVDNETKVRASVSHASNHPLHIYDDTVFAEATSQLSWDQRTNKAAFYSSYSDMRRMVWEQAVLRPDLIDAPLSSGGVPWGNLHPWNARSNETTVHR